ncbi:MAG: hypothetical protein ACI8RT_001342 [Candidatus Azotimanducaceae bacterium]|jgi:hypothetical protein|tara:strand:+ start:7208 stop:7999 length:792 start_codon:yes stop_codon:yes gene_type:complete
MFRREFLALLLAFSLSAGAVTGQEAALKRVLFIGNSYLYYNDSLHNHVERMAIERHPGSDPDSFEFKSATIGGASLKHHNIDWLLTPGQIGAEHPFQVVVMQGASFEALTPETRKVLLDTAVSYAQKVRLIGAKPMLYMTHAYVAPHRLADKNMINIVSNTYIEAGQAAKAKVIPVGLAYALSYQKRPSFSLHADFDHTHPNLRGTYLGACVVYLSLYDDDLEGLSYDYFGRLAKDEALYLQQIARETVDAFAAKMSEKAKKL